MQNNFIDPLGVMTEGIPSKSDKHFNVGDGWEIILAGEEVRRPSSLKRVAITRAEVTFSSEENFIKFLEIIKETDQRLSKIPDIQVMYDWQLLRRKGLTVRFGVAWYDEEFYQTKMNAHLSELHSRVFSQFGVTKNEIRIEHIPL